MAEIFRIIGKNDIHFDLPAGTANDYRMDKGNPPRLGPPLTREETLATLKKLPLGVRPQALKRGLSTVEIDFNINGESDAVMEGMEHALIETLVETDLYFSDSGLRGTRAVLQYKMDATSEVSFKSVWFGKVEEVRSRDVLGTIVKAHRLEKLRLTLYCESHWRPSTFNHLFNGGFEHWDRVPYGGTGADTEPDGWDDVESVGITGTNNREGATIQHGTYSLKVIVTNSGAGGQFKGVTQNLLGRLVPGVTYTLVGWIKNAAITNGAVQLRIGGDISGVVYAYNAGAANTDWTRYSIQFTPHEDDTTIVVMVVIRSNAAGCSGTVYFDSIMVVRGTVIPDAFIEWHPNPGIKIGPNLLSNAGFEEWHSGTVDSQPDCWLDDSGGGETGTNNQESTEVLQGCFSLEIDMTNSAGVNAVQGVIQHILSRLTVGTEYILSVWVKNEAISLGKVKVFARGDVSGYCYALDSGAANDDWTRYDVTFTPNVADAFLRICLRIQSDAANCDGTAYFDKLMVIEASVYNGHSFAPEEWTGCGYVFNHYDGPCGAAPPATDCGHVNYLNVEDIRGDVDSRIRLQARGVDNVRSFSSIYVGRRTQPCNPCEFAHFLEAEDGNLQTNWPDHADNARSDCEVVSQGAGQTSGRIEWILHNFGDLQCQAGRFRALIAVYVDYDGDPDDNVSFRASVGLSALAWMGTWTEGKWVQPLCVDNWHWLDMGAFDITGWPWCGETPWRITWCVQYQKEDADLVEFDFLLLLPEDESAIILESPTAINSGNYEILADNVCDFNFVAKRYYSAAVPYFEDPVKIRGTMLALRPKIENRLIFGLLSILSGVHCDYDVGCYVHETADTEAQHFIATLYYLPQFVSPLE